MKTEIILAGFGGQGILFAGKVLAYAGLACGRQVSWLPSYGPEMRGGTANCSVCISDEEIGNPMVGSPDLLIVMNKPSFERFIDTVKPGGTAVADESLIDDIDRSAFSAIHFSGVPATQWAKSKDLDKMANMIMLGRAVRETGLFTEAELFWGLREAAPRASAALLEKNEKALRLGMDLK